MPKLKQRSAAVKLDPAYSWRKNESDPMVADDELQLWLDGKQCNVCIQIALYAGGYGVNRYGQKGDDISTFWMQDLGIFRSLETAKAKAIAAHKEQPGWMPAD